VVIFTVPVVLSSRVKSGTDAYGNDVYTPTDSTVDGIFAPGGSVEQLQGQDIVTDPADRVSADRDQRGRVDAVTVGGQRFEVDGAPNVWPPNPFTGWLPEFSVEVKLRRVTG
jgi:hypothetical protein